jgi:GMP synthase-like glutamine amidotransferase
VHLHLLDLNDGRPNRGTAAILALAEAAGVRTSVHAVRDRGQVPAAGEGAWILGGGPGSPLHQGPWRAEVLGALRTRLREGLPTLGICYGFQLMAEALGGSVRLLPGPREGVYGLEPTWAGVSDPVIGGLACAGVYECRRWGVFGGPGTVLADGEAGDRVAVRYGPAMLGVVFHPEADLGPETSATFARVIPAWLAAVA